MLITIALIIALVGLASTAILCRRRYTILEQELHNLDLERLAPVTHAFIYQEPHLIEVYGYKNRQLHCIRRYRYTDDDDSTYFLNCAEELLDKINERP